MEHANLKELEQKLEIKFNNLSLLETALTHSSYTQNKRNIKHNERLEFFGDAVLKLLVSEYLYEKYTDFNEGELSKIRAQFVADKNLTILAKHLNFGKYLRLSISENKSGGRNRPSILACSFEAFLGAYYLDSGLDAVKKFIRKLFIAFPDNFSLDCIQFDYKSRLQEIIQAKKQALPAYSVIKEEGPDHMKIFHIKVSFEYNKNKYEALGIGSSKKSAEQQAAQKGLKLIKKD